MADERPEDERETAPVANGKKAGGEDIPARVLLVPYPKIVFLYPSFIMALICGIWMSFAVGSSGLDAAQHSQSGISLLFLLVLGFNLVVLGFDFPRTTSLTLFFILVAVVLGCVLLFTFYPHLRPSLGGILDAITPVANPVFYFLFAGLLGLIYIGVLISTKFDYWEVRANELLHHHGFLSNLERYSAPHLRVEKEIGDVFEYFLLRSGKLILTDPDHERPIVLENVLFISRKEKAITQMLGSLQVRVRQG